MSYTDQGFDSLLNRSPVNLLAGLPDNGIFNNVTESVSPSQIESGSFVSSLEVDRNGDIRGGVDGYADGSGFFLGWDETLKKYVFFVGNSAGDNINWNGTTLAITGTVSVTAGGTIGGFDIGSDYIRDAANSFGLASTVTGGDDVRFWAGDTYANRASAPFRVTEAGTVTALTVTAAVGDLVTQHTYTTGHAIDQGDAVARGSGAVYRTRIDNFSANGTASTVAINAAPSGVVTRKPGRFIDVSSTVKLALWATGNATDDIAAFRVVCSPSSSSITSTTLTASVDTRNSDVDGVLLDTNKVFMVANTVGGADNLGATILSGLDTTVTVGTPVSVAASASFSRAAVVKVSTSEVLVLYTDTNGDIIATSCTVSGTTITVGSSQTILGNANTLQLLWAERFESTTAYCVYFYDSTGTTSYVLAFTYSAGSYSIGSAVSVASGAQVGSLASMGDSVMLVAYSSTTSVIANGITRSGTTLTVGGSPTTIDTVSAGASGTFVYASRMGKGNATLAWCSNSGGPEVIEYQAVDVNTVTVSALGSSGTVTTTGGEDTAPMMVRLSPTRSIVFRDTTNNLEMATAVIDWSTNFDQYIGIAAATVASGASLSVVNAGDSDDLSGLTDGTTYYLDCGGALTTSALGGSSRAGVATGTGNLVVQT